MFASFATQMLFIVAAVAVVDMYPSSSQDDVTWNVLMPVAAIAFQSSGQAVVSRALECNGFTSVVLTSIYCDLFSDTDLFAMKNADRNRRVAPPVLLLIGGAACGLYFARSEVGITGALWTAASLKFFIAVSWLLWPGSRNTPEN